MPFRMALILFGLFIGCLAVVLLAWAIGSEFYVFLPSRRFTSIHRPPTHPAGVLLLLGVCVAVYLYSPRHALFFFTALVGGILLGSLVGYGVFDWKPTVMQGFLTIMMIAEAAYGWSIQDYYLDD
jgi:hypothetical protein